MGHAPSVITFVGHSGSGKTTLIEELVRELTRRGLRIATIKHAHHKVELDTPGKDSHRYKQAGAAMSMLVSGDAIQLVADAGDSRDPKQLAQRYMSDADLVLVEGFSLAGGPKIEVLRRACSAQPRCNVEDGLIALVTDVAEAHPQLPHFALDDLRGIVEFILQRAKLSPSVRGVPVDTLRTCLSNHECPSNAPARSAPVGSPPLSGDPAAGSGRTVDSK